MTVDNRQLDSEGKTLRALSCKYDDPDLTTANLSAANLSAANLSAKSFGDKL